ncbi:MULTISPECIES: hypothetical protein [Sphingobium]|nr:MULTISPECIES: hypothetical protein [Sphingobium]MBT2245031.1 hypothetical protein [Sphingobium sp. BHU LFT2]WBQ19390.1 hypothetical protein PAE53_23720 [Sphingobium yanoikuyae]
MKIDALIRLRGGADAEKLIAYIDARHLHGNGQAELYEFDDENACYQP